MVSSKFLFDDGEMDEVFMDEWAASSGMTCKQLVQLERDFLKAIVRKISLTLIQELKFKLFQDWKIYASELAFWKKLADIETQLAGKEGKNRGHFTYTELQILGELIGMSV